MTVFRKPFTRSSAHLVAVLALGALTAVMSASPSRSAYAAELRSGPDAELAKGTVFEVALSYGSDASPIADAIQPGFLVKGKATGIVGVTSYMPLHGATAATARFMGSETRYDIQILTAMPSRDVALIRLVPVGKDAVPLEQYLELAPGDLRNGQTVWTLHASRATGDLRAIPGLVAIDDQNTRSRGRKPFDAPGWLFAKENNRRFSGYPMVDDQGRLVGINVWGWPTGDDRPLGLNATTVDDLITQYGEELERAKNKGEELKPIPVKDARAKYNSQKRVGSVFPAVRYKSETGDVSLAKRYCASLTKDLFCDACDGNAAFDIESRDKRQPGNRKSTCTVCGGKGIKERKALAESARRAARAITSVPHGTPEFDKLVEAFAEGAEAMQRKGQGELRKRLNTISKEWLNPDRASRGDAVMFVGSVSRDSTISGDPFTRESESIRRWEKDVKIISSAGDDRVGMLGIAPDDTKVERDRSALIVGVIVGFVSSANDDRWVVLDRVVAVPFGRDRQP